MFRCTLRRFAIKMVIGLVASIAGAAFWIGVAWIASLDFWPDWDAVRPYFVVGCASIGLLIGIFGAWAASVEECKKEGKNNG